jgi:hypothetical protein
MGIVEVNLMLRFVSPVQNWKFFANSAQLEDVSDFWFNFEEIDEQMYAQSMGWA